MAQNPVRLILPTAINLVTLINDNILTNYKKGTDASIALPPLRERAKLVLSGTGLLTVVDAGPLPASDFTR